MKSTLEFDGGNVRFDPAGNAVFTFYEGYVSIGPQEESSSLCYQAAVDVTEVAQLISFLNRSEPTQPPQVQGDAEVAEIEKRHEKLDAMYKDAHARTSMAHRDRATLLRILRERAPEPATVVPARIDHILDEASKRYDERRKAVDNIAVTKEVFQEIDAELTRWCRQFWPELSSYIRTQQVASAHHVAPRKDGGTGVGLASLPPAGPGVEREALAKWFAQNDFGTDKAIAEDYAAADALLASGIIRAWPTRNELLAIFEAHPHADDRVNAILALGNKK